MTRKLYITTTQWIQMWFGETAYGIRPNNQTDVFLIETKR